MAKRIFMLLSLGSALLLASCGHKEEPKEVKTAFLKIPLLQKIMLLKYNHFVTLNYEP